MLGAGVPVNVPNIVKLTCTVWERAVKKVIGRAPYTPELQLWSMQPFQSTAKQMTVAKWRTGGCNTVGDLYMEGGLSL